MRAGVVLPGGTATEQLEQAVLAEQAGWDGVFVWEAAYGVDAWTLLAAIAARTSRVRLGTMLTPLPWRRPWKVASQVATLDQLSGGRAILAVGVGAIGTDLPDTGEVTDVRARAELLDEAIDLIRALWAGAKSYHGQHYHYECDRDDLAAAVPARPAADPDLGGRRVAPAEVHAPGAALRWHHPAVPGRRPGGRPGRRPRHAGLADRARGRAGLDMVAEGETPADDAAAAAAMVSPWAEAGCTWWLETRWEMPHDSPERMREIAERIAAGPPA